MFNFTIWQIDPKNYRTRCIFTFPLKYPTSVGWSETVLKREPEEQVIAEEIKTWRDPTLGYGYWEVTELSKTEALIYLI